MNPFRFWKSRHLIGTEAPQIGDIVVICSNCPATLVGVLAQITSVDDWQTGGIVDVSFVSPCDRRVYTYLVSSDDLVIVGRLQVWPHILPDLGKGERYVYNAVVRG